MCTACQSKMNGLRKRGGKKSKTMTKRRRRSRVSGLNSKEIGGVATSLLLPGIAGAIAGTYLNKLPFLSSNPQYVNYAAVGIGLVLATSMKNPMVKAAGVGMAIGGGKAVAQDLLDGQGVGLLPPGVPSVRLSGLSNPANNVPGVLQQDIPGVTVR